MDVNAEEDIGAKKSTHGMTTKGIVYFDLHFEHTAYQHDKLPIATWGCDEMPTKRSS
jgi:hypothetical protein